MPIQAQAWGQSCRPGCREGSEWTPSCPEWCGEDSKGRDNSVAQCLNFQLRSKRVQKGWSVTRKEEMVGGHGDGERPTPGHVQMRMVPLLALHREAE